MKKWFQLALFNLFILASLGLMLRYKTVFSLPFIEYQNLLHSHSHFAFNGWITFVLQLLIVTEFTEGSQQSKKFWNTFFLASTVLNYGILMSFAATGYGAISIALSTISLFLSYIFCYKIYKAIPAAINENISTAFTKAAMFFLVISSLGPYALAVAMATKADGNVQHNALYFFLYFQYAGWFTFAILSFLCKKLERCKQYDKKTASIVFNLFLFSCIPAYLFVCSFNERSTIVTIILIGAAVVQSIALVLSGKLFVANKTDFFSNSYPATKALYCVALLALGLKFVLQFLAIYPPLQQILATSRPITIAYLHLVFLCFVSVYLLAAIIEKDIINTHVRTGIIGAIGFVAGIIINESLLATQGTLALFSIYPQSLPTLLFLNTTLMMSAALFLFIASIKPLASFNYSLYINIKYLKISSWKL